MTPDGLTRRFTLRVGLSLLTAPAMARAAAQPRAATKVLDFETLTDVATAEVEGAVTLYMHDSDPGGAALVGAFSKDFPKIKATYFRAQNGAM